jgi:RHS repeat-associated protein
VRTLTDVTGTVTDTYDYDAWGNAISTTGSTPNVYLYRAEQYDPDLNLYYLRARYLNPAAGRFLSTDPAAARLTDPRTLHRYLYAAGDPVNRIDPTGRLVQRPGSAAQEYVALLTISLMAFQEIAQVSPPIRCIWEKVDDWLEIEWFKLLLDIGSDAVGPPDPNTLTAGGGGDKIRQYPNGRPGFPPDYFPGDTKKCRQIKCLLTCYLDLSGDTGSKPPGRQGGYRGGGFKAFLGLSPPPENGGSCDDACRNAQEQAKSWAKDLFGNDVQVVHCNQKPGGTRECWQ